MVHCHACGADAEAIEVRGVLLVGCECAARPDVWNPTERAAFTCQQCHRAPSRDCTFGRCKADEPRDTIEAPPVEAGRRET
jgi:hypothetical protein